MTPFNKYAGEAPFPYADAPDGITKAVFRYTMRDLERLATRFGEKYLEVMLNAQKVHNVVVLEDFIRLGLKGEGGSTLPALNLDDPPFPLGATYQPMYDAMMFSITGMTAKELAEREAEEKSKFKKEVDATFPLDP